MLASEFHFLWRANQTNSSITAVNQPEHSVILVNAFTFLNLGIGFLFGCLGNVAVFVIIAKTECLKILENSLHVSLAVADLINCILLPIFVFIQKGWPSVCSQLFIITVFVHIASFMDIFTLVEISILRTFRQHNPLHIFSRRFFMFTITLSWIVASILASISSKFGSYGKIDAEKSAIRTMYIIIIGIGSAAIITSQSINMWKFRQQQKTTGILTPAILYAANSRRVPQTLPWLNNMKKQPKNIDIFTVIEASNETREKSVGSVSITSAQSVEIERSSGNNNTCVHLERTVGTSTELDNLCNCSQAGNNSLYCHSCRYTFRCRELEKNASDLMVHSAVAQKYRILVSNQDIEHHNGSVRSLANRSACNLLEQELIKKHRYSAISNLIIVCVFLMSYLPTLLLSCKLGIFHTSEYTRENSMLAMSFTIYNSCLNPYIYAFRCKVFRNKMKRIFFRWRHN